MCEVDRQDGVGVRGCGNGLVAVAVVGVVGVNGAGHNAAAAAASNVAVRVVARCAVLGIEAVPAWIVHELALAASGPGSSSGGQSVKP